MLPGTNVRVIPTQGLNSQSRVIAGPASYILLGMNAEMMTIKSLYAMFADVIKLNLHATYGTGVFDVAAFVSAE
jgi:hypothetical protein